MLLQLDVHWNVPGWYECFPENKPCKQVCARTYVSCACMAHGLQCLCVRGACCPSLLKRLVIWVVVEVSTVTVICCYNSMYTGLVPGWYECSTQNKLCKQVCACTPTSWVCKPHSLQCLCVEGTCCSSLAKQLVFLSCFLRFLTST